MICGEEKTTRSDRLKFRLLGIEFFSPIYNGVRIFPACSPPFFLLDSLHYTLQEISFFRAGSFFPGYFLARFFSLEISLESRRRPESAKVLLVEFGKQQSFALKGGILGFGTRNTAQGSWNSPTIGIQNQSSTIKESEMRYMESGNYGVESRNQDCCP